MDAYLRRKNWEYKQQALHIVAALGEAMSDKPKANPKADPLMQLASLGVKVPLEKRGG